VWRHWARLYVDSSAALAYRKDMAEKIADERYCSELAQDQVKACFQKRQIVGIGMVKFLVSAWLSAGPPEV